MLLGKPPLIFFPRFCWSGFSLYYAPVYSGRWLCWSLCDSTALRWTNQKFVVANSAHRRKVPGAWSSKCERCSVLPRTCLRTDRQSFDRSSMLSLIGWIKRKARRTLAFTTSRVLVTPAARKPRREDPRLSPYLFPTVNVTFIKALIIAAFKMHVEDKAPVPLPRRQSRTRRRYIEKDEGSYKTWSPAWLLKKSALSRVRFSV